MSSVGYDSLLHADPILDQRHSLPVNDTGETSIISFTWRRSINSLPLILTVCCWSVSDARLTDDDSTINMTVNTCANGGTAYNCSDATWFCGPAVINMIGSDESQVISGSFKIIPSMINDEEMIEATVDNECSVDTDLFSILFPNELAACKEEESSIISIATALLPTTTEYSATQSPSAAMLTSNEISSTSVQQATAASSMFTAVSQQGTATSFRFTVSQEIATSSMFIVSQQGTATSSMFTAVSQQGTVTSSMFTVSQGIATSSMFIVSQQGTSTSSMFTAVSQQGTATSSMFTAVSQQGTATSSMFTAVSQQGTATSSMFTAVSQQGTATSSMFTAVSQQGTATSSMFTAVSQQGTATSSMFTIDPSSSVATPSSVFNVTSSIQAPVTTQLLSTDTVITLSSISDSISGLKTFTPISSDSSVISLLSSILSTSNKPAPTLSVSSSQISTLPSNVMPPVIVCKRDGEWIETAIKTTVTIQNACYGGTTAGE